MKNLKSLIKSNKGVSLVELVIGMAILAVLGFAIATFMKNGTVSFASTSKEVNLQYDTQLVTNRINDLMSEANDITFSVKQNTGAAPTMVDSGHSDPLASTEASALKGTGAKKTLSIITASEKSMDSSSGKYIVKNSASVITWDPEKETLKYATVPDNGVSRSPIDSDGDGTDDKYEYDIDYTKASTYELLAENVNKFTVDFSGYEKNDVKVIVGLVDDKKQFVSTAKVALRNAPTLNSAIITGSGAGGAGGSGGSSTASSVVVTPKNVNRKLGQTVQYSAAVFSSDGMPIDQSVSWTVDGGSSTSTKIDSAGRLTIGGDETATSLTIKATSLVGSVEGSASLFIKEVTEVTNSFASGSKEQNGKFVLNASVIGTNIDSGTDQAVVWKIEDGASWVSQVGTSTFKIMATAPEGTQIQIRATSVLDPTVSALSPVTIIVQKNTSGGAGSEEENNEDDTKEATIVFEEWPETINRGGAGIFNVTKKNADNCYVTFDVEAASDGKALSDSYYRTSISGTSATVYVMNNFSYSKTADIKVTAYLVKNGDTKGNYITKLSKTAKVEVVSLKVRTDKKQSYNTNLGETLVVYYMKGATKVYYELSGIENSDVDWKIKDKSILRVTGDSDDDYFRVSAKDVNSNGETYAEAYIGSYSLGTTIKAKVSPGNIRFNDPAYGDQWVYIPCPSDDDFVEYGFTDEKLAQGWCNNYANLIAATDQAYLKIKNTSRYYVYLWYVDTNTYRYGPGQPANGYIDHREIRIHIYNSKLGDQFNKGITQIAGMNVKYPVDSTVLIYKWGSSNSWEAPSW